jgi:hypothetical protein
VHCYGDAIKHIPDDLAQYSSIIEDIQSARQQLLRSRQNLRRTQSLQPTRGGGAENPIRNPKAVTADEPNRDLFTAAFNKVGPRNADSVPLPLIILAGLAMLLIAAGGAGLVARRLRARKLPG